MAKNRRLDQLPREELLIRRELYERNFKSAIRDLKNHVNSSTGPLIESDKDKTYFSTLCNAYTRAVNAAERINDLLNGDKIDTSIENSGYGKLVDKIDKRNEEYYQKMKYMVMKQKNN